MNQNNVRQENQDDLEAKGDDIYAFDFGSDDEIESTDISKIKKGNEPEVAALRGEVLSRLDYSMQFTRYQTIDCCSCRSFKQDERPLVIRHSFNIPLNPGAYASIVYYSGKPNRRKKEDRVTQKFIRRWPDDLTDDHNVYSALFGPKGQPYAEGHAVLGNAEVHQKMTKRTAELFLTVLTLLGNEFEGFFNGVAPGWEARLHSHFIKRKTPIFDTWRIEDWPIQADRAVVPDISSAADWIQKKVNQFEGQKSCDFLFRYDLCNKQNMKRGINYTIICISRKPENKIAIETLGRGNKMTYNRNFGTFGVLEVGGYCIAVKTEAGYRMLQEKPWLYKEALEELNS